MVAFPHGRAANWGFAIAASLLAASGLLFFENSQTNLDNPVAVDNLLAQALESSPSRSEGWDLLADGRQLRPVLSFQSNSDGWCREYVLADQSAYWHGVACRTDGSWETAVISPRVASAAEPSAEYRPAGAGDSAPVQSFVDTHARNIPLSASEESALIANGWK